MKLKVKKESEELVIKVMKDGNEKSFNYIEMINDLYNQEDVELIFTDEVSDDDKEYISNLFGEIKGIVQTKGKIE